MSSCLNGELHDDEKVDWDDPSTVHEMDTLLGWLSTCPVDTDMMKIIRQRRVWRKIQSKNK